MITKVAIRQITCTLIGLLALTATAHAADYPGSALLLQNGGTNPLDLFTISGSVVSLTGDLTGATTWSVKTSSTSFTQLVGIRTIFLVNTDGTLATPTIPTTAHSGYVRTTATTGTITDWIPSNTSDYHGYDDGASGKGFPDGSKWLVLADPSLAGKDPSSVNTYGRFDMGTTLLNPNNTSKYYLGIDYIVAGGQTARGYITNFSVTSNQSVPEPGSFLLLSGVLPLVGLVARRRTK